MHMRTKVIREGSLQGMGVPEVACAFAHAFAHAVAHAFAYALAHAVAHAKCKSKEV